VIRNSSDRFSFPATASRLTAIAESVSRHFNGLRRHSRVGSLFLTAEAPVSRENRGPGLQLISEKQYQPPASLARNCRFFLSRVLASPGRFRHSLGAPSDLINRIPYEAGADGERRFRFDR
jgi:hypothetical protein